MDTRQQWQRLVTAAVAAGIAVVSLRYLFRPVSSEQIQLQVSGVEAHEKKDVDDLAVICKAVGEKLRPTLPFKVTGARMADTAPLPQPSSGTVIKKLHLVRHGEGTHNVAQKEWRAAGKPGAVNPVRELVAVQSLYHCYVPAV